MNKKILTPKEESCPDVKVKSESECAATSGSKPICWSPGVFDVDCATGNPLKPFGLCCFDGCQNSCMETCKTILKNITEIKVTEKCTESIRDVCHPKTTTHCENVCRDITIQKETKVPEEVCTSKLVNECRETKIQVRYHFKKITDDDNSY